MKRLLFLILALFGFCSAQSFDINANYQAKYSLNASYYWGTIIKHTAKFDPEVTEKSHAFELSFSKLTDGKKAWQRKLNYPEIGGAILAARFGDNAIFGNAIAIFPYAKIWLLRSKKVDWYFRMGLGLAYLNKPYNAIENSTNNVIGSKINNCTQLSMGIDIKVNKDLAFFTALNFTHFSNASYQAPNLGINYAAFSTGFRYMIQPSLGEINTDTIPQPQKRHFFKTSFGMALYEYRTPGGPKYPIYIFNGAYAYSTSISNRIFTGFIYGFDVGRKDFLTQYVPDYKKIKASDLGFYLGDEIFLGKVSVDALIGVYLLKAHDNSTPIFAKLGLNYNFYQFGPTKESSLFIGVHMKTHYFVAQYFDVSFGVNL